MAVLGLKTVFSGPQSGNTKTLSVTCTAGTNTGLFVVFTMANTVNFNNAFYDGQQMHRMTRRNMVSTRQVGYWLPNPPTGSAKTLEVRFTGSQYNPISVIAQSFTGVTQNTTLTVEHAFGLNTVNGVNGNTPHSRSITIGANDVICLAGISTQGMAYPYVIGGANAALLVNQHNVNGKIIGVAFSGTSLSAGSTVCTTVSISGQITNQAWVIGDGAGGGGSTRRRRILIT